MKKIVIDNNVYQEHVFAVLTTSSPEYHIDGHYRSLLDEWFLTPRGEFCKEHAKNIEVISHYLTAEFQSRYIIRGYLQPAAITVYILKFE